MLIYCFLIFTVDELVFVLIGQGEIQDVAFLVVLVAVLLSRVVSYVQVLKLY